MDMKQIGLMALAGVIGIGLGYGICYLVENNDEKKKTAEAGNK